jgi:hypothetical protein
MASGTLPRVRELHRAFAGRFAGSLPGATDQQQRERAAYEKTKPRIHADSLYSRV